MANVDGDSARELECLLIIGRIAGKMAHEINNPLAGIQNAFQLVKDAIPPSHPHFGYVAAIEREIRRIAAVTRRFCEEYRPDHDRAIGIAITAIVHDAARMTADGAGNRGIELRVNSRTHAAFGSPAGLLRHA